VIRFIVVTNLSLSLTKFKSNTNVLHIYLYIFFGLAALLFLAWLVRYFYLKKQASQLEINGNEILENIESLDSNLVSSTFIRINSLFSHIIKDLAKQDYYLLNKHKKRLSKLKRDVNSLREAIFHNILTTTEDKEVTEFYVLTIENMEDMVSTLGQILKISKSHINKNRKTLTFNQVKDLQAIDERTNSILENLELNLSEQNLEEFERRSKESEDLLELMEAMLSQHIDRIRSADYNPKNFKLYTKFLRNSISLITQLNKILYRFKET